MNRTRTAAVASSLVALLMLLAPQLRTPARQQLHAPPPASISEGSYRRARAALDAGVRALGGLETLRAVEDITLREVGRSAFVNQSPKADPPFMDGPQEETLVVDLKRNRLSYEVKNSFPGGTGWTRNVVNGGEGVVLDMRAMTATPINNPSVENFRPQMRRLPNVLLLEMVGRAQTLRWLGEDTFRGRRQNVVTFVRTDGRQTSVYFDAETGLPTKYDSVYTGGATGDSLLEMYYGEYRDAGGIKVPRGRTLRNGGDVVEEREYAEVKFNARPSDAVFAMPASGFTRLDAPPQQAGVAVEKLAEDVYLLRGVAGGNYNVLFVAFDDHVLVVDAPEGGFYADTTRQVLAKIKETVPGKPVKHVVLTHHHSDHAGGVRGYVAEGVTVVTTAGNRGFLERLLNAPFTVEPDALALKPRQPLRAEYIENKKRVFADARHTVEVHDIGPNPHAEEMVVAYLPKEKILFQADLVGAAQGGPVNFPQDSTLKMAERVRQLGLDVERIAGAHGRVVTMEEFREALDKRGRAN